MRFQLGEGWPIRGGSMVVPASTILDRKEWSFNGIALPWPPPLNVICLDQEAFDEMLKAYPLYRANILTRPFSDIQRSGDK